MACIEAAEGGCALRLADIVFSSVRNCAALGEMGWEDRGVVSGRKILTAVSTLGWNSEYGYHGATGNMREALCPERTGGFPPSSVGSLGCSGGWCSTSCVEAVALRSPIRWRRCCSDGKRGFVEGHESRQGGLLHLGVSFSK
jgi:hypothetical protein